MSDAAWLSRLKQAQQSYANAALRTPSDKTSFDFGFRCGVIDGYEQAINTLLKMADEEEKDEL